MRRRWLDDDRDPLVLDALRAFTDGRGAGAAYALVRRHRGPIADNVAAAALIVLGRLHRAERRLARMDPADVNYLVVVALRLLQGRDEEAWALLAGYPVDYGVGLGGHTLAVALHRTGRDAVQVLGDVTGGRVFNGVAAGLFSERAYAEALAWLSRGTEAVHAYDAACSCARMGDGEAGLRWLSTALDRGWDDAGALDGDEDLASLRELPGWAAVRARLGDPSARR